jgi:sugar (pentulose or hexulose) kinase
VFADVDEAVASCVRTSERIEPDADWVPRYAEGYAQFRELYPALRAFQSRTTGDSRS